MDNQKRKVLFLCTGNSARSQTPALAAGASVAEAIVNHTRGARWMAFSAGTCPKDAVHPFTIRALKEIGIDASHAAPKAAEVFRNVDFDLVVTVCDSAAEECPVWLGAGRRVHMGFLDPAQANGSEEKILDKFRQVRDDIQHEILIMLAAFERVTKDVVI